eukprot:c21821_g2_i2.p1 GENE.c21821_g2_i2~~c21821_g2_i2.p1  ORF type:complete len:936 (-),score=193.39 c21821_g2_i2:61-2568(-)
MKQGSELYCEVQSSTVLDITSGIYPYFCFAVNVIAVADYGILGYVLPDNIYEIAPQITAIIMTRTKQSDSTKLPTTIGKLSNLIFVLIDGYQITDLPSEVGNLKSLKYLSLAKTKCDTGTIPSQIGRLTDIEFIRIRSNGFSGYIPTTFGLLTSLSYFVLVEEIRGDIFTLINDMNKLDNFSIGSRLIKSVVPSEISKFTSIRHLRLNENSFLGTLPPEVANLTNLYTADFADNLLSGSIPSEIGLLTKLSFFRVRKNRFNQPIPKELSHLTDLNRIEADENYINGTLPSELALLNRLTDFSMGHNIISGTLPSELGLLKNLDLLNITTNRISGILPVELFSLSNLKKLVIHKNRLSGTIPTQIYLLEKLTLLYCHENYFSGPIKIENMINLEIIDLSYNHFEYSISPQISMLSRLNTIKLAQSGYSGKIPLQIGNLNQLSSIDLSYNINLIGSVPSEILQMIGLYYLNISYTRLTGSFTPRTNYIYDCTYSTINDCYFQCNSCPSLTFKGKECKGADDLEPVCISVGLILSIYFPGYLVCVLVIAYLSPRGYQRRIKSTQISAIGIVLVNHLSNGLFIWLSDGEIFYTSITLISLVAIFRLIITIRVFSSSEINNSKLKQTSPSLRYLAGVIFILCPDSLFYVINFSNAISKAKLAFKLSIVALLFQNIPQLLFQFYYLFSRPINTIILFSFTVSSISLLMQVSGTAITRAILHNQKFFYVVNKNEIELQEGEIKQSQIPKNLENPENSENLAISIVKNSSSIQNILNDQNKNLNLFNYNEYQNNTTKNENNESENNNDADNPNENNFTQEKKKSFLIVENGEIISQNFEAEVR